MRAWTGWIKDIPSTKVPQEKEAEENNLEVSYLIPFHGYLSLSIVNRLKINTGKGFQSY